MIQGFGGVGSLCSPHRQPDGGSDMGVRRKDDVLLLGEARQVDGAQVDAIVVQLHRQTRHL